MQPLLQERVGGVGRDPCKTFAELFWHAWAYTAWDGLHSHWHSLPGKPYSPHLCILTARQLINLPATSNHSLPGCRHARPPPPLLFQPRVWFLRGMWVNWKGRAGRPVPRRMINLRVCLHRGLTWVCFLPAHAPQLVLTFQWKSAFLWGEAIKASLPHITIPLVTCHLSWSSSQMY